MNQQLPPGPPPTGPAVPGGWTSHWSEQYQQVYYVNNSTGESSWTVPVETSQESQSVPGTVQRKPVPGLVQHQSSQPGAGSDMRDATAYAGYPTQQPHNTQHQQNNTQFPPPPSQMQYPTPYSPPQQGTGSGYFPPAASPAPSQGYSASPYPHGPSPGPYQSQQQGHPNQGPGNPSQQYFSPPPTPGSHYSQQQNKPTQSRDAVPQYQPSPAHNNHNYPPPPQNNNQQHNYYPPPAGQSNYNSQYFSPPITPGVPPLPSRPQSSFTQATSKLTSYLSPQPQHQQYGANPTHQGQQPPNQNRKASNGMMGKIGSKFGQLQKTAGPGSTASPLKKWGTRAALGIGAIGALTLGIDGMDGSLFDGAAAGASGFDTSGMDAYSAQEAVDANAVQLALEQQGQQNALMLLDPPGTVYVENNSLI